MLLRASPGTVIIVSVMAKRTNLCRPSSFIGLDNLSTTTPQVTFGLITTLYNQCSRRGYRVNVDLNFRLLSSSTSRYFFWSQGYSVNIRWLELCFLFYVKSMSSILSELTESPISSYYCSKISHTVCIHTQTTPIHSPEIISILYHQLLPARSNRSRFQCVIHSPL